MELVLAAIGVAVAFAMILASSKRSRRAPPQGDRQAAAGRSRHKNEGGDGGEIGNGSSESD